MYKVTLDSRILYYPGDKEAVLVNPEVKLQTGYAGQFTFTVPPVNPLYGKLRNRRSMVSVYRDNTEIFYGEVRKLTKKDRYNNKSIYCTGAMSFLSDSIQPQAEYHDMTSRQMLETFLRIHNSQVEDRKKIYSGMVTVTDSNNSLYRYTNYENTLQAIREKLVDRLGGYLRLRHENDKLYLDWIHIEEYGKYCSQPIEFGLNLMDYSEGVTTDELVTALVPLGARLSEGSEIEALEKYVDITSVNGGSDFIYAQEAVDAFGWVRGTKTWQDVTVPANLLQKGRQWLQDNQFETMTLNLTAVDLSALNKDYEAFDCGDRILCRAKPYGMNRTFPVMEMNIPLQRPDNATLTLGENRKLSYTEQQSKIYAGLVTDGHEQNRIRNEKIKSAVDNATTLITGGKGGYVVLDMEDENGKRSLPWRILIMDSPDKEQAKSIIQLNKNGLGFSTTGIGGPYRNAWTIDGSLVADFITAGTMYADRIKGGTLTLGGLNNDNGILKILNAAGKEIGSWTKDGIVATAGKFTGNIEGSTIKGGSINIKDIFVVDVAGNTSVTGSHFSWSATNSSMKKDGTLTCKGLKATEANITGKVTATSGEFPARLITGRLSADHIDATSLQVDAANITGKLTADQINAAKLKVDAANITGKLTANQINTANLQVDAANITGKLTASQINTANLQVDAANITGTLEAAHIETNKLTISGSQISEGTIGTSRFNSGVGSWVGGIAADKIAAAELSADKIYPNKEEYIWFPQGPVLVTRLQIDGGSSITCRDGWCGTNDYPFAQGWFNSVNGVSARKLKKDIKDYAGGLDVVMKTEVKRYRMKKDKSGRLRYGFIAEDAPCEIVTGERQGIDLYNCIGILFSAVQELNEKMEVS